jgi:hypothetical protein
LENNIIAAGTNNLILSKIIYHVNVFVATISSISDVKEINEETDESNVKYENIVL